MSGEREGQRETKCMFLSFYLETRMQMNTVVQVQTALYNFCFQVQICCLYWLRACVWEEGDKSPSKQIEPCVCVSLSPLNGGDEY